MPANMPGNINDERDNQKPEIKQNSKEQNTHREKEVSISDQSSNEPEAEKIVPRQRRAEVQNPLMHESY